MVHGIHHWNYLGFNVYLFNDIHVNLSMDVLSYKAKTSLSISGINNMIFSFNKLLLSFFFLLKEIYFPLHMDGHGSFNCMWVLHILIESPTYIQLIVSRRIWNFFLHKTK
jgi:hypothetical protein